MSLDKNVEAVCQQLIVRSYTGLRKYGVTTEREDIDLLGWLQHLQEELLDAAVYVQRLKQEVSEPPAANTERAAGTAQGGSTP